MTSTGQKLANALNGNMANWGWGCSPRGKLKHSDQL